MRAESNRQDRGAARRGPARLVAAGRGDRQGRAERLAELAGALGDDLRFVLITSAARRRIARATAADGNEFFVDAAVSEATKCERCWHYRADVGIDPAHPTICGRCTANLFGAGEAARDRLMAASAPARSAPWLGIALAVIVLDQITKAMIVAHLQLGERAPVTPFFDIVRAHNPGAAFSFLNDASGWQRWFFVGLGIAAAVFIVWLLARHGGQRLFGWALALILGGALGNVIDRLLHGHVVDFIQVHWNGALLPVVQRRRQRDHDRRRAAHPRRAAAGAARA